MMEKENATCECDINVCPESLFPTRVEWKKKKSVTFFDEESLGDDQQGFDNFYLVNCPQQDQETDFNNPKKPARDDSLDSKANLADLDIEINFDSAKRKKKKSHKDKISELRTPEHKLPVVERLWSSGDSDYTYEYLLARFYRISKQERPRAEACSSKLVLKPPQILRIGTKKTSFANFTEMCRQLHRPPNHLMTFILAELGTSGSVDGSNQLVIRGRFQQCQMENVLRRYIKDYVKCHTCNSMSTMLRKEIRLYFLICEACESRRSVPSIKSGFQAVTGKRAALRAKISS